MPFRRAVLILLLVLLSLFATPLARAAGIKSTPTDAVTFAVARVTSTPRCKSVGGALQRAWAYDGGRIVAEFDGAGKMTARFVYGTRPQVPDTMIQGGEVYRLLTDHLGSVRLVVRLSDGKIVQQLAYDPWGEVETDTNPGFQPFGFAGGIYDPDTRLVRFGARDYDPAIGRWTAKDPSGFAGGTNLYTYANNDPVNLLDLTGENPVVFMMLAGAMEGIAGDLFFQMVVQGKRRGCLDGQELAMAGIMGALSSGLGGLTAEGVRLEAGQVGRFGTLNKLRVVGDDLTPHHMPQSALNFTSRADGGALMMRTAEHERKCPSEPWLAILWDRSYRGQKKA